MNEAKGINSSAKGSVMAADAHCHAWRTWPYEWRPNGPDCGDVAGLLDEMAANNIDLALVVSARIGRNPDNNDYVSSAVLENAASLRQCVDVDSKWSPEYHTPGAAERLRREIERTAAVGVTHYLGQRNDGWLRSREAWAFLEVARKAGLVVSLAIPPPWQPDLRLLAQAFPTVPILCHHVGSLGSWAGALEDGLDLLLPSSELPNVHLKLSGPYYGRSNPRGFPYPAWTQLAERLAEVFGPERLIWGSDYPPVLRAMTYSQALELVRDHCVFLSQDERDLVLRENLRRLLGLAS